MKTPIKKKSRPTKAKPRVAPIALLSAIFFVLISLMVYKFLGMKDTIDTPTPVVTAAGPSPTPTIMLTGKVELLNNKWEYMPGTEYSQSAGLVIHPYRFSFVSQDSLEFTSNPPINLAGVYLDNVVGDFTLVSKIDLLQSKTAHIRFYGKLPIIADEFRVERESIQLAIEKGKMTVDTWTGSTQLPFASQIFTYSPNTSFELSTQRKGSKLIFAVNGVEIGQVEELGVFNSGQVWFGLDAVGGDWTLASFVLDESKSGKLNIVDSTSLTITDHNPQGLQALATKKRPGFFIGTAVALGPLVSDPDYSKLALDNNTFGSLTPENEMKMANIQPQRGVFDFKKADAIVKIAKQNGIDYIHGHALVFGEATPEWFSTLPVGKPEDREQIQQIMLNHIETVVKHYGDQVQSWDVVNEPLADYDRFNLETGEVWRNHKWYQAMGVEYLIKALTAAHNANPTAYLFINEYGLEQNGERWDFFVSKMAELKSQLEAAKIPIEKIGIGFQSHIYEPGDQIDPTILRSHIQALANLGFKVQISELDVYSYDGDATQSRLYADVLAACINEPNCVAWRVWILTDRYNVWREGNQINFGKDGLYGVDMKARPAIKSLQAVLNQ